LSERGDVSVKAVIGIALLMIIVAAGTSYVFLNIFMNSSNGESEMRTQPGPTYDLGGFIVNLSGGRGHQVIQADIVVEVSGDEAKDDLERRSPQVRDSIIRILRRQSVEDLAEPEIDSLKQEIRERLNEVLSEGEIREVWFTRLVVQ